MSKRLRTFIAVVAVVVVWLLSSTVVDYFQSAKFDSVRWKKANDSATNERWTMVDDLCKGRLRGCESMEDINGLLGPETSRATLIVNSYVIGWRGLDEVYLDVFVDERGRVVRTEIRDG